VRDAVLSAERHEAAAVRSVVLVTLVAIFIALVVVIAVGRGLAPLAGLLESARAIARGSLDVPRRTTTSRGCARSPTTSSARCAPPSSCSTPRAAFVR
jgi:nitrogen fixation/metabolism regulation signal transduction histidine kinase